MPRYDTPDQAMDAKAAAGPIAIEQERREAEEARRLANLDREQEAEQRLAAARDRKATRPKPSNGKPRSKVPAGSKAFRAKYEGTCPNCELPVRKGEWIFIRPARHEDCIAADRAWRAMLREARKRADEARPKCEGLTGRDLARCRAQAPPKPAHDQRRRAPRLRGRPRFATSRRATPAGRRR